jgi:hypothetical protein
VICVTLPRWPPSLQESSRLIGIMRGPGEGPALLSKLLPSSTMKAAGQKRTKATPVTGHGRAKQKFAHNPSSLF